MFRTLCAAHRVDSPTRARTAGTMVCEGRPHPKTLRVSQGRRMTDPSTKNEQTPDPWGSYEPYVQLVRSLLPRATSVSLFDAAGAMRWTSETTTGPDFYDLVENAIAGR